MAVTTRQVVVPVAATTGDVVDPIGNAAGIVVGIYVQYTGQPGTCIVTVKTKGANAPSFTILTLTAANTSGWFRPLTAQNTNTGATVTYDGVHTIYDEPAIDDFLEVTVASGGVGNVTVWVMLAN